MLQKVTYPLFTLTLVDKPAGSDEAAVMLLQNCVHMASSHNHFTLTRLIGLDDDS